ncbi:uncharacterized protein BO80DRAFT_170086 [Aspergillus ibericus CBS 121593]|uniref:Secreted protein n=1 Tax=Aspergillus ibericus CBS 121593 TaxID=1448316 RepID=A0A395HAK0_9EURO|nr:hypothetical protein BO80DRAFT_170086 [Aspergillus ibericus CBS 121593]RAL04937.1 hypothetical protein BO80DRAFT_170086 [Aspergillus ibericus CBS 121593]
MRLLIIDHTIISALASISCSPPPSSPCCLRYISLPYSSVLVCVCMIRYRTCSLPLPSRVHTPPQPSTSSRLVPSITHISKIGSYFLWHVSRP